MDFDPRLRIETADDLYRPSDDSFLLLSAAEVRPGERFLEVGTGTGLIAIHAARVARCVATDANPAALGLASENARRNGVRLDVVRTDLMAGVRGPFDVIAFNPPYLEGEPRDALDRAWDGGAGGAEVACRFLEDLPRVLAPEGRAYLLLSHRNAAAREIAESRYRVRVAAAKRLFFEVLEVLEIRAGPPRRGRAKIQGGGAP